MASVIKKPTECTKQEFEAFAHLVIQGRQVDSAGLEARIKGAKLLAFYYRDEKLVGVAAIKQAQRSYINRVFSNANETQRAKEYQYEIGWAYTLPDYRKRGVSTELIERLLCVYNEYNLFATTGINNITMENILEKYGFKKCGLPYWGRKELKQLYIRSNDR